MKNFSLLFLAFFLVTCDKCKDADCIVEPISFELNILDKQSQENLFSNGTYKQSQLSITSRSKYEFINATNTIVIYSSGLSDENVNTTINIADQIIFDLYYHTTYGQHGCCSASQIIEIRVEKIDYDMGSELINILV